MLGEMPSQIVQPLGAVYDSMDVYHCVGDLTPEQPAP